MLITSNRIFCERGTVFGGAVVATAILDRLRDDSHVVGLCGVSTLLHGLAADAMWCE